LWCPDPKSPKFLIGRHVTFDENFIFQWRKKYVIDSTGLGEEASKQMKLESKVSEEVQESTHVEPVDDAQCSTSCDDTPLQQQYNIATERVRRQICPPKKYTYADMVIYTLSVAESIARGYYLQGGY